MRRGSNSRTEISIHALRGEGDSYVVRRSTCYSYFNPRPPWGGRPQFLVYNIDNKYFNPRPPWGGRHAQFLVYNIDNKYFNPRPPWGGRPSPKASPSSLMPNFNPRPPWGGRLYGFALRRGNRCISIHALRGEGDRAVHQTTPTTEYFNPRPPWGGRPIAD